MRLNENKDVILEMGNNANKLARKQFDRTKLATQFVDFLESIYADK